MPIQKLRLDDEKRKEMARIFQQEVAFAVSERVEIEQRWARYAEIYESRAQKVSLPWPDACGVSMPMAPTHADSLAARLTNAFFGQEPLWIVKERQAAYREFAVQSEAFLGWVSEEQLQLYPKLKQVFHLMTQFGTVITYTPWQTITRKFMQLLQDRFEKVDKTMYDGPMTYVIPPWNFLIRGYEDDCQEAQWCGYKVRMTWGEIQEYKANGFFYAEQADQLAKSFTGTGPARGYSTGERDPNEANVIERREQLAGITRTQYPGSITLYHLFARYDVDNDNFEEQIDFFFDPIQGIIPRAQYLDTPLTAHGQRRPFDKWGLIDRGPGVFWDIGVLELLEGLSDTINTITRQVIDNNFVQNTKWFTILNTSKVKPGQAIRPGKAVYVGSHDEIQERDMGSGVINTSLNDIGLLESQMQQRTGLSDPNLGQESGKRVPATTIITLIQEGQKRLDLHIRDHKFIGGEFITRVAELYHQKKPTGVPYEVLGPKGEILSQVWRMTGKDEFRKRVLVRAAASSAVLNKATDRQEKSQAFTLLAGFYDKVNEMVMIYFNPEVPPQLKTTLSQQYSGLRNIMRRILSTHDFPDPDIFLPDPKEVFGGQPSLAGPVNGGIPNMGETMGSLLEMGGTPGVPSGPAAPLGRPLPGVPRLPGTTPRLPPREPGLS